MKIAGLQKTTLIDYPGKVACTIFLHGCNFRCRYCYNPELVVEDFKGGFNEDEVIEFLKSRKGKLDAVCFLGGEPLLSLDLEFVKKVKKMGFLIKIDTNGSFPKKLKELIDKKLIDFVSMDIKADSKNYSRVTGIENGVKNVEKSIKLIHKFGKGEFRTTVLSRIHDAYNMREIGRWMNALCGGKPEKYFIQGFKNSGNLLDESLLNEPSSTEEYLNEMRECVLDFYKKVEVR